MIVPGLVSVTLRERSMDEIVDLAAESGLQALHWGGDVHVPVGDHTVARAAAERCAREGIEVEGYGSYHAAGEDDPDTFAGVVETAAELGAPRIRVWAGRTASAEATEPHRTAVTDGLRRCADAAAAQGIQVVLEYHPGTLTDEIASATTLLDQVDHEGVESYWQPLPDPDVDTNLTEVDTLLPRLTGAHVFAWGPGGYVDRLALADHEDRWRPVLEAMASDGHRRHALLEFVQDDDPANVRRDAQTLRNWLRA